MNNLNVNSYNPDYVSPPGETLLEVIEERGISQAELARRMGRPSKTVNEIIKAKTAITPETSLQLEKVLDIPAGFWDNREMHYRQYLIRKAEEEKLNQHLLWVDNFPIREMMKLGWIESTKDKYEQLINLLHYFSIASPNQWTEATYTTNYRMTEAFQSDIYALSAWLKQGEKQAQDIYTNTFDKERLLKFVYDEFRKYTLLTPNIFQSLLVEKCSEVGIAVVFVPQLKKTHVSGAARWLTPNKALVQLSLRYKTNDHFWFAFFHEVGHILLHGKRRISLTMNKGEKEIEEKEADNFASEALVSQELLDQFARKNVNNRLVSKNAILAFAKSIGIAPGIVVGRLQHGNYIDYRQLNGLKEKFEWKETQ